MNSTGSPADFQSTTALDGQECFLYSQVLLREEKDGILGFVKVISTHNTPKGCLDRFAQKHIQDSNQQCPIKWNETGKWVVIRRPETDTEATIDIVKTECDEDFYGEPLVRENIKNTKEMNDIKDRASMDQYKDNVKEHMEQEKKIALRKKALDELESEIDDPTSISSYAQLHWKRLTQKSQIGELKEKIEEAQVSLVKSISQIKERDAKYPDFKNKWEDEIRRIHSLMARKQADNNPVDKPIANLGNEDDEELATLKIDEIKDDYDTGLGVERKPKGKEEMTEKISEKERKESFLPKNMK